MAEEWVGLADAIKTLRSELTQAIVEGQGQWLRFELGPVEMQLEVAVTKDASVGTGAKFWVLSLGGKAGVSSDSSHTLNLTLHPKDPTGKSPLVSDDE